MTGKDLPSLNMSARDFDKMYEDNLSKHPTYKSAYEATEKQHEQITGHKKYRDNESFRVSRSRRIKKHR